MQKAFIIFDSITYAQLARDVLLKHSIRSTISRLKGEKGCGYVLYTSCDTAYAYEILTKEKIRNKGIGRGDGR